MRHAGAGHRWMLQSALWNPLRESTQQYSLYIFSAGWPKWRPVRLKIHPVGIWPAWNAVKWRRRTASYLCEIVNISRWYPNRTAARHYGKPQSFEASLRYRNTERTGMNASATHEVQHVRKRQKMKRWTCLCLCCWRWVYDYQFCFSDYQFYFLWKLNIKLRHYINESCSFSVFHL